MYLSPLAEIEAYKAEEDLWIVTNEISNSAGNLCLHLIGNLNHFIGAVLGNTKNLKQAAQKGNAKKKLLADQKAQSVANIISELKKYGVSTLSEIAKALNARGIPTVRNGEWYPSTVKNYMDRCSVNVRL